jgi:hypothetical protein
MPITPFLKGEKFDAETTRAMAPPWRWLAWLCEPAIALTS